MRYAAEDCPVNRMKDRDAGAWDAQALCGLFQCPGCGLTPVFVSSSGFQLRQRFFSHVARKGFRFGKGVPLSLFGFAS